MHRRCSFLLACYLLYVHVLKNYVSAYNLGDDNVGATMQHVASGTMLVARINNELLKTNALIAQQMNEQNNRQLKLENTKMRADIKSMQDVKTVLATPMPTTVQGF